MFERYISYGFFNKNEILLKDGVNKMLYLFKYIVIKEMSDIDIVDIVDIGYFDDNMKDLIDSKFESILHDTELYRQQTLYMMKIAIFNTVIADNYDYINSLETVSEEKAIIHHIYDSISYLLDSSIDVIYFAGIIIGVKEDFYNIDTSIIL